MTLPIPDFPCRTKPGKATRSRHSRGFTLVEVMVALVVVGVALPALLSQVMSQVDGTLALREQTVAHWVAQNQWARLQLLRRIKGQALKGTDSGEEEMLDRRWQWNAIAEPTEMDGLVRITISVGPADQTPLVELEATLHE